MQRQEKLKIWYTLYGRLLDVGALEKAFKKVKAAKGAPGIDGQSTRRSNKPPVSKHLSGLF